MFRALAAGCVMLILAVNASRGAEPAGPRSVAVTIEAMEPMPGLEHLLRFGPAVINGSAPEGDRGFESLKKLEIRTIISVEAATPDLERADAAGMRYVHLPIGYDKVPVDQGRIIARAIAQLPGPVYIHCSHGQHRSPAAAAFVLVALGQCDGPQALAGMKLAGVGEQYPGLYASVAATKALTAQELAAAPADFPAIARTDSLEQAMAKIGRHWDHLKLLAAADWKTPADHPDLTAASESEVVSDLLEYLSRSMPVRHGREARFGELLDESYAAALSLKRIFNEGLDTDPSGPFEKLGRSCTQCHAAYRDR